MNTTDNIKSLFNSANPMTTENSYEPSGVCIGDTVLDNTPSGFALFQAIGGHYTSPAQAIEELVDNAISSIRANGGSGKVILCLTDGGDYVDISVYDSGTGISDLGAAPGAAFHLPPRGKARPAGAGAPAGGRLQRHLRLGQPARDSRGQSRRRARAAHGHPLQLRWLPQDRTHPRL